VIAPLCTERIKAPDECRVVDSTLPVDGVDCGGGGLRSGGDNGGDGDGDGDGGGGGGGGRGSDIIRRRMVGGVVGGWWRGWAEKEDNDIVEGEGGDGDNVDNVRSSGTGDDGTVIASRESLRAGHFRAQQQHSSEAMFTALVLVGAAVAFVISGGNVGGGTVERSSGGEIVVPVRGEEDSQALQGSLGPICMSICRDFWFDG
jgi:hypothetical protein